MIIETLKIEVGSKNQFIAEFGKSSLGENILVELFLKSTGDIIATGTYESYKKIIAFQDKNKESFEKALNIKMQKTPAIQLSEDQHKQVKKYFENRISKIADTIVSGEITLKAIKNNTDGFDNFEDPFRIDINFNFLNYHEKYEVFNILVEKLGYQNRISVDIQKSLQKKVEKEGDFKLTEIIPVANPSFEKIYKERLNLALEKIESNGEDENSGLSNYGIELFPKGEIKLIEGVKLKEDWEDYAY